MGYHYYSRIIGNESVLKIIVNDTINLFLKSAISILVISNDSSFWVLFDKISVYFIWKIYLYFSIGNGQPMEPALCQLNRHTFIHYSSIILLSVRRQNVSENIFNQTTRLILRLGSLSFNIVSLLFFSQMTTKFTIRLLSIANCKRLYRLRIDIPTATRIDQTVRLS